MTREEFERVVESRIHLIQQSLLNKGHEYALTQSAFHNFEQAARILNVSEPQALIGMYIKHHVSIMDFVNGVRYPEPQAVREKIGDMINYLILLEAMFYEQDKELPF